MLTIIDAGRPVEVEGRVDGDRVLLSPEALQASLGWEVHGDTLCNDAMCVPLPAGSALASVGPLDLAEVAAALDRPLVVEAAEAVAYLGASARERAGALSSLEAPDFTLPDLAGRPHRLSEHRGMKVLLVAWASW
jgi:hypothetical protein